MNEAIESIGGFVTWRFFPASKRMKPLEKDAQF